jgi:hypothetical protein
MLLRPFPRGQAQPFLEPLEKVLPEFENAHQTSNLGGLAFGEVQTA